MHNNGTLAFNRSDIYTYSTVINGTGNVKQIGIGETVLGVASTYTGSTEVYRGTLSAGAAQVLNSNSDFYTFATGTLNLNGFDQTVKSLNHGGMLKFGQTIANQLTVTNNYQGTGGTILFNTVLNDSSSATNLLNIQGDAIGSSLVDVNNMGGLGAQTTGDGIKLIDVQGTSTGNTFSLARSVNAGAYEYVLGRGAGANNNNWYLRNSLGGQSLYTPNAGAYLMSQYVVVNMFKQSITDRRNAVWAPNSNIWMRVNHNKLYTDIVRQTQRAKLTTDLVQIGADLYHKDNFALGVYGGYGHADINNKSKLTKSVAKADVDGYHVGVYGSWILEETGLYVDVWSQYVWYDNNLKGKSQKYTVSYNSDAWTTSAEVGYGLEVMKNNDGNTWIFEPHVEAMYTFYNTENFTDSNLTRYSGGKAGGLQTRLGARYYRMNKQTYLGFSPFIEINWLHNAKNESIKLNQHRLYADMSKDILEAKIGIEGN